MSILILGYGKTGRAVYDYIDTAEDLCEKDLIIIYDDTAKISHAGVKSDKNVLFFNKSNEEVLVNKYLKSVEACITSPGIERNHKLILMLKKYNVPIYGEIEFAYNNRPKKDSKIVCITGTNGKTTTATLCKSAIEKAGLSGKTFIGGNLGIPFISGIKDYDDFFLEISSFQLEWIYDFKPDIAVLLNVEDDHLDRYENFDEYRLTKYKLFKNLRSRDIAVLNYGDYNSRILRGVTGSKSVLFGFDESKCDVYYKDDSINLRLKDICGFDARISLKNIIDKRKFVIEDMMAAACLLMLYGISPDTIVSSFEEYRLLKHRVEYVGNIGNIEFYDDSKATNPAAVISALRSFAGKNAVVILGGKDKGFNYESLIKPLKEAVKACVLMGETKDILINTLSGSGIDLMEADDMCDAVKKSFDFLNNNLIINKNDKEAAEGAGAVILSPASSSFDMFKDYNERGDVFKKCYRNLKENFKDIEN